ncbi:MAG: SDR family NAD(P)-dependent oxidoreductase [Saprospiraceae bacterium]|nr:SDR family NAD(P)-dependent oxidoreductase [Saprospiraceae bacterium]
MIKSVLITGANAGIGKETARQLALKGVKKIYLGCRNEEKANAAKADLENATGKSVFEVLIIDVTNLDSVRAAIEALPEPVEALVMNAGGMGGPNFNDITKDGVTQIFAVNVLGHVVLAEGLIAAKKLTNVAIFAGSEAARGVENMGMKRPELKTSSLDEFATIADGSFHGNISDPAIAYGPIKYMGALWMSSLARKHNNIRIVTMSPGATSGTEGMKGVPFLKRIIFTFMFKILALSGNSHGVKTGAKRYVDGLLDESFKSGVFYASKSGTAGPLADQSKLFADLGNERIQDNASDAIHRFIK